jgi:hypothetical protein
MRKQGYPEMPPMMVMRLWTYAQAVALVPYLRSLVRSRREQWLQLRQTRTRLLRLDANPGRPDRNCLILRQELCREAEQAEAQFEETVEELLDVGVVDLDPAGGMTLIPFVAGEELAWFIFDLFSPRGIDAWRFDLDPLDSRRPLHGPLRAG